MFYSKEDIKYGTTLIKGRKFKYVLNDDYLDLSPVTEIKKTSKWKPLTRNEIKSLELTLQPDNKSLNVVGEINLLDAYFTSLKSLRCSYKSLFIRNSSDSYDGIQFSGPTINQLVQNHKFYKKIGKGIRYNKCSLIKTFVYQGINCDISCFSYPDILATNNELRFRSKIYIHFASSVNEKIVFDFYNDFSLLAKLLAYRRDVYFDCEALQIKDGNNVSLNGRVFLESLNEKDADDHSKIISLESVLPAIGELLDFIHNKNIVPLFIPTRRELTFSDSVIIATAWLQLIFKQIYVPSNAKYSLHGKYNIKDSTKSGKDKQVYFKEQATIMIHDSYRYIKDFYSVKLPFMVSGINTNQYLNDDLPTRLTEVRNAVAHGNSNPDAFNYSQMDMTLLICSIYVAILKKKCNLKTSNLKTALAELLFDITDAAPKHIKKKKVK